jgi:hypothetical protein
MIQRAGWVARRRPLAGPLSPRGSQPVLSMLGGCLVSANESPGLTARVRGLQYKGFPTLTGGLVTSLTGGPATNSTGREPVLQRTPPSLYQTDKLIEM